MENFYYEVIGNYGCDGEENGTGYKTLEEARARVAKLGDCYESYTIYKRSGYLEADEVETWAFMDGRLTSLLEEPLSTDEAYKIKDYIEDGYKTSNEII